VNYDALVVGGGPAGATAALLLARAGWSVALVERKSFPRRKVCGEFISATTEPLLRDLGIDGVFAAQAGPPVRRVGLFAGDTELAADMPQPSGALSRDGTWGRALGREHLDLLLLEGARRAGATVWQPWTAVAIERGALGHGCTIAHKGVERALFGRVVIVAQGSSEKACWRNSAAPAPHPRIRRRSDLLAFKAHLLDCDLPDDLMPLLVFPGGYGGMVRSDGRRVSLSCCVRRDALRDIRLRHDSANAGDAMLAHILASCGGVRAAAGRARLEDAWLSAGPIRPGIRPRYREGLFFIGNTAGEAHPVIAEGISMAMQSAAMLCGRLTADPQGLGSDRTIDGIGAAYAAEWKRAFSTRIHAAAAFAHLAMRPRAAALWVPVLRRFPQILTWGAQLSGKATETAVAS
jgi:flavin-dependent dehydrogenase